jgi:prepilin-type N-terminal cleavage/methylation domain-containing protein
MTKLKFRSSSGFTLIELLICVAIVGILAGVAVQVISGKGLSEKDQCIQAGGRWTEGLELGLYTALCTYGANPGN